MNIKESTQEQISALADGELDDPYIDAALASLRQSEHKADWALYHQIGDVLRSDDMAVSMSFGFAERMAARLDAEPTIVAPIIDSNSLSSTGKQSDAIAGSPPAIRSFGKRWALPGVAAAAAVAAIALVSTPQLMVAMKRGTPAQGGDTSLASISSSAKQSIAVVVSAKEGVILRDPRIDEYLLAHQRYSPSVYSSAQYARSATFATDSTK